MFTKFGLPIVAIVLIAFAVKYLAQARRRGCPKLPPPIQPAANPFPNTVAGAGMVEPETENISVGSPVPGVVVEVMVKVGQKVKAGDPLFRLDDRQLQGGAGGSPGDARRRQGRSSQRLEAMPRPEELPRGRGQSARSESRLGELGAAMGARRKAASPRARCREEEFMERKQSAMQARERYNRAVADFDLLKAGAWEPDKRVAQVGRRSRQGASASRRKPNSIGSSCARWSTAKCCK